MQRDTHRVPRHPAGRARFSFAFFLTLLSALAAVIAPGCGTHATSGDGERTGFTRQAITATAGKAYIPNAGGGTVTVIDTSTGAVCTTSTCVSTATYPITVGTLPQGVAVSADGTRAYVANSSSNTVSVIDTATDAVIATVSVGSGPFGVAALPNGSAVYVTNSGADTVSVIRTSDNTVTATISLPSSTALPHGIAATQDSSTVYLVTGGFCIDGISSPHPQLVAINTSSNTATGNVVTNFCTIEDNNAIALSSDGSKAYVNSLTGIAILSTSTGSILSTVSASSGGGTAVSPDGSTVYVAGSASSSTTLSVIKGTSVTTVTVGHEPQGVSLTTDGTQLYVANYTDGTVSVVNTATLAIVGSAITVGTHPLAMGVFIQPPPTSLYQAGKFGAEAPTLANSCPAKALSHGMCTPTASKTSATLALNDTPVGVASQKGPDMFVKVSYNHADTIQPASPNYSNLGPRFTHRFLSYVQDDPTSAGSSVTRYVMGGGMVDYTHETSGFNSSTGIWGPEIQGAGVLERNPASGTVTSYTLTLPDGSVQTFAQADGASSYPRRVFLTGVTDPQGNALSLSYDSSHRLTTITDAESRTTAFCYDPTRSNCSTYSGTSLLISQITDPFGRSAIFSYDSYGRLSSIQDVLGITSSFTYGGTPGADAGADGGAPGDPYFISQLTTPYGTSNFAGGTDGANSTWLELTDPDSNTERVEYNRNNSSIGATESSTPSGMTVENGAYNMHNTFYWDRYVYPTYGTGSGKDYTKAEITHWALNSAGQASPIVASVKGPLENRVYFTYPGQSTSFPQLVGTYDAPADIGRVMDDASSQVSAFTYNSAGNLTQAVDPLSRTTKYTYASNNIDATQVQQLTASGPTYSTIAAHTYNSLHEPLTTTDAATQVWTYTYNSAGQLLTVTDPLSHVTTYGYDSTGRLTTITDANSVTYTTLTYSSTCGGSSHINCDVPSSVTDSEGRTVSYARDALDRITTTTYPDGTTDVDDWTFQSGTYSGTPSLEVRKHTDRLSRVTTRGYDAERRLTSVVEPTSGSSTRTTTYDYFADGTLKDIIDANSGDTRFAIDVQSRPTSKTYAYGTGSAATESYAYESTTSRLHSVTDALSQVKTIAYDDANERTGITYTASVHTTPNVTWAWDTYFPRQTSMTDGTGTTNYSYTAIGTNGALTLSSNAGPYSNDTTGLTYDADGRPTGRTISGGNETWSYDALSRVHEHVTGSLPDYQYSYLGETNQPTQRYTSHGGTTILTSWSYDTNTNDRRLTAIGNSNVSRSYTFSYGTASDGGGPNNPYDILSSTVTPASGHPWAAQTHSYTYDLRDRLLTANQTTPGNFTFAYDKLDNATTFNVPGTSTSPTYNVDNQVATWGSLTYSYDANGNLTSGDGVHTYKWDAEDRLIEIDYVGTSNTSTFTYNGIGERISNTDTIGGTATTTRYLWCDALTNTDAAMAHHICQTRDGSDTVQRRQIEEGEYYVSGPYFHGYLIDQLGSVRDAVDLGTGNFVQAFEYTPYGAVSAQFGWHYGDYDYWYANMFVHQASGIYFSGTRPYDPATGRWLRRDPIREAGGVNLYGYTGGNPVNWTDPSGLAAAAVGTVAEGTTACLENPICSAMLRAVVRAVADAAGSALSSASDDSDNSCHEQYVVRGGIAKASDLQKGTYWSDNGYGFSVQTAPGVSVDELARGGSYKNKQISVTTNIDLMSLGLTVNSPTPGEGLYHGTVGVPAPPPPGIFDVISGVFSRQANPHPVPQSQ